ncbi:MAG: hypothetical protein IMZ52_04510 [Actinobacteria bacterium]|nr:hypothetical protein [Actinomycetota bacterium]
MAKAVLKKSEIQKALEEGIVVVHPSSTTVFIMDELGYGLPPTEMWICGLTTPRGLCASRQVLEESQKKESEKFNLYEYKYSWVFRQWKLELEVPLGAILEEMGSDDIYVKGVNAIDAQRNVGVLFAAEAAGTIGVVRKAFIKKKFKIIIPVGLEKMIPGSIIKAAKKAPRKGFDYATGTPCGLMPLSGDVITELEAIEILTGASATVVGAGGVAGAEGSVVMAIEGNEDQINKALDITKEVKGAKLPHVNLLDCAECTRSKCFLSSQYKKE